MFGDSLLTAQRTDFKQEQGRAAESYSRLRVVVYSRRMAATAASDFGSSKSNPVSNRASIPSSKHPHSSPTA